MEHPFEHRAHYNAKGEACHCPWGFDKGGEHLGSVRALLKEASKLEWLEGRPDLQTNEGQDWLHFLSDGQGNFAEEGDKMLPWLTREWQKGRIFPDRTTGALTYGTPGGPASGKDLRPEDIKGIQSALDEMKKRGKGVDVMQHKVHELMPKVKDFQDWKQTQERKDLGEPVHRFDDGWTVRQLQNRKEMEDEGNQMGHCVGREEHGCPQRQEGGHSVFASLRDPNNFPHATIEMTPHTWEHRRSGHQEEYNPEEGGANWIPRVGSKSNVSQFYGKEDSIPLPEYVDRMNQWVAPHGIDLHQVGTGEGAPDEEPEEDPYVTIPGAKTVNDYNGIEGEYGNFMEYAPEDSLVGEHTEYNFEPHDFDAIARDYLSGHPLSDEHQTPSVLPGQEPLPTNNGFQTDFGDKAPERWGLEAPSGDARRELFETARNKGHDWDIDSALQQVADPQNANHQKLLGEWATWNQEHQPMRVLDEAYGAPMVTENSGYKPRSTDPYGGRYNRNPDGTVEVDENGRFVPAPPVQGPWQEQWAYHASSAKPLYHRWIYSPSKGVTLGSNSDDHPAFVKYHQGLGGDINDTDLTHGYAYPIGNGWRVTDYEHKALEDPYIVNQVVRRLNHEESPQIVSEGSWQASEYDWDRLHYGLPREKIGRA